MKVDKAPLFWRRGLRVLASRRFWVRFGILVGAIIVLQLLFPYDRAFFRARIDGQPVGLKSSADIQQYLAARYNTATVTTIQPTSTTTFSEAGVKVDYQATAEEAIAYPVWQRLIPLSAVYRLFHTEHASRVSYRTLSLKQWADSLSKKCQVDAKDAGVIIKDSRLTVIPSSVGYSCPPERLIAQLERTQLAPTMKVDTQRQTVQPNRTDSAVKTQLQNIQAVIDKGVKVQVLDSTTDAATEEIVSWLQFKDGDNHALSLDIDPAKVQPFIVRVQKPIYVAPGVSIISLRDGQEVSRTQAQAGRGVDANDLIAKLRTQLQESKSSPIIAKVASLPPSTQFQRSYTNSTPGLQALLNDVAAEKGNMAIAVTELSGGQGRSLSVNGDKQYHPASTYKLFVAYSVIKRIEAGQLKWNDQINGTSVDECLTRMIVNSDNACAEAFAEKFSWAAVQTDVKSIGATGTNLNLAAPVSTVKDQALYLQKLYNNQLMKTENKDKLLALMKRQVYRSGIPSGVKWDVADKVGFLSGYLHDSGLVYTSHGVYAISIYSNGGSWGNIADAAKRIEALLNS